jgi:hypothetical protein
MYTRSHYCCREPQSYPRIIRKGRWCWKSGRVQYYMSFFTEGTIVNWTHKMFAHLWKTICLKCRQPKNSVSSSQCQPSSNDANSTDTVICYDLVPQPVMIEEEGYHKKLQALKRTWNIHSTFIYKSDGIRVPVLLEDSLENSITLSTLLLLLLDLVSLLLHKNEKIFRQYQHWITYKIDIF